MPRSAPQIRGNSGIIGPMPVPQPGSRTRYSASIRARERKNGTVAYDVRYRLDGSSRTLSFTTHQSAREWATMVRQIGPAEAIKVLQTTDHRGGKPTVDDWAETYISGLSGIEGKTTDHYRLYMKISISPTLGVLPIDAITPANIAQWINEQATRYAAKTIKNRHGFLSAMFQAAVDDGLIDRNPCAKSRLPESEQGEMVFLSPDEYRTLLTYIPSKHRLLVQLIAATGMRWGEVSALKPTDFDFKARTVRVARAWKHSTDRGWYVGAPKTKRSRRTISLPSSLIPELRDQARFAGEWMFTNRDGQPWRHTKFYEDYWKPAVRLANGQPAWPSQPRKDGPWDVEPAAEPIGKWPGIHSLRHSHASWLIADGIDMVTIQRRLGHESIHTTTAIYTHLSPDMLLRPAESMERMLQLT
jgi:integrase